MIPLSDVAWGPIDSLDDTDFTAKWVEPTKIRRCLSTDSWIVSGQKGSGKSAIRRAITDIYGKEYIATAVVDFNEITFSAIYSNVIELSRTTNISQMTVMSHYWQYAILIELIKSSALSSPERYRSLERSIPQDRVRSHLDERLLSLLEEAWNKIDQFTGIKQVQPAGTFGKRANLIASAGLTSGLLHDLSTFPLDSAYKRLKADFFRRLADSGDKVILMLDGFDRLKNDETAKDSIGLIFASLVDAVLALKRDADRPRALSVKAFIPHDRYLALSLRDADKLHTIHSAIEWDRPSLQRFIQKRVEMVGRSQYSSFSVAWRQVFPEYIVNSRCGLQEESFSYILRHTMYRPRQMQIHLSDLAAQFPDEIIEPAMVPDAVAASSRSIARYFVEEYRIDLPNLERFIQSFHRRDNIMDYKKFREIAVNARRFLSESDRVNIDREIDNLYAMGFFGVLNFVEPGEGFGDRNCPPTREKNRHYVDFFYNSPHPSVSSYLQDESQIALHPVFIEYANLKSHPGLIVG